MNIVGVYPSCHALVNYYKLYSHALLSEKKAMTCFARIVILLFLSGLSLSLVPNGYLLILKSYSSDDPRYHRYYNHLSLFNVTMDGQVTELWNYSSTPHVVYDENNFAIDLESGLVYLGMMSQYLALDLKTGKPKISIELSVPNLQYFWNYDFYPADNVIRGICTGDDEWNWCDVKRNGKDIVNVTFHYQMPSTNVFGPIDEVYSLDRKTETIWYLDSSIQSFTVGVHYPTGNIVFTSGPTEAACIGYDNVLNKTFTVINTIVPNSSFAFGQVHPAPTPQEKLFDLPSDLRTFIGTCVYDTNSHTMFVMALNKDNSFYRAMPDTLLSVDAVNLSYKRTPLPGFAKHWESGSPITGVKFIQ